MVVQTNESFKTAAFNPEKYDYRDFLLACDTIGIDWERIEGKFWFYSDDFDADIKRLRNQLAIDSDLARAGLHTLARHGESTTSTVESPADITAEETAPLKAEPQPKEVIKSDESELPEENDSFFQVPFVILIALAVAVVVFLSILLINRFGNKTPSDEFMENTPPSSTTLFIDKD